MKRLSKNILSLITADLTKRILGFISVTYLARILSVSEFGVMNLGFAVLAYGMVFSSAGFTVFGTKKIAQGIAPEIANEIFSGRLITTMVVVITTWLISIIFISDTIARNFILLMSLVLLPQIFFVDWFFQGKERMGIVSSARVLSSACYLLIVLIFVKKPEDIFWIAIGSICGDLLACIFLYLTFKKCNPEFNIHLVPPINVIKKSLPLSTGIILATVSINFPFLMLGIISTSREVGLYSAASKLVFFLLIGDRIISSLLLPAVTRKLTTSIKEMQLTLQESLRWIVVLCLPILITFIFFAIDIVVLVFGEKYKDSAYILRIFIWYFLITMIHSVYTTGLISIGKDKEYARIMVITTILYLVFVFIGSWQLGAIGAAIAVIASEAISAILLATALLERIELKLPQGIGFMILAALAMNASMILTTNFGPVMSIILGFLIYLLIIFTFKVTTWKDIRSLIKKFL